MRPLALLALLALAACQAAAPAPVITLALPDLRGAQHADIRNGGPETLLLVARDGTAITGAQLVQPGETARVQFARGSYSSTLVSKGR